MSGLTPAARVVIAGGPTAEEIAAVVVALDQALAERDDPSRRRPAWQEAARREGVGWGMVRSRWDLARPPG